MAIEDRKDLWPCACLKRDRKGNMTHIKMHPRETRFCRTCKAKRPPAAWFETANAK